MVHPVTLRRLGGTRITLWQSLTSGVHTSVQRLSKDVRQTARTRCCGRRRRCLYGTRQAARSWQLEIERGIEAAGMVVGEDVEVFLQVFMREIVRVVHGEDILLTGPRSLVDAARKSLRKRNETQEQVMGAGPIDAE